MALLWQSHSRMTIHLSSCMLNATEAPQSVFLIMQSHHGVEVRELCCALIHFDRAGAPRKE